MVSFSGTQRKALVAPVFGSLTKTAKRAFKASKSFRTKSSKTGAGSGDTWFFSQEKKEKMIKNAIDPRIFIANTVDVSFIQRKELRIVLRLWNVK
jgi:hypothetical protein